MDSFRLNTLTCTGRAAYDFTVEGKEEQKWAHDARQSKGDSGKGMQAACPALFPFSSGPRALLFFSLEKKENFCFIQTFCVRNTMFPVFHICTDTRVCLQRKRVPLLVFTLSNILTLISYILRAVSEFAPATGGGERMAKGTSDLLDEIEDVMLAIALPLSWFYLIFFAGGMKLTGPFVSMIRFMMVQDMTQFSVIYLIFIYAFSQGEWVANMTLFLCQGVVFHCSPLRERQWSGSSLSWDCHHHECPFHSCV